MQLDNRFIAFWMDTTTAPWTPITGLSATIIIREATAPYTVVVNNEAMTEMWWGHYIYVFTWMSIAKEYTYICNPNATAFIESGVTQNTLYKWIEENRSGWGAWHSINLSGVTGSITNLQNTLTAKIDNIPQIDLSEIKSHIDIAKTDIIDTIDSIEIPESKLEEKEAKKALKIVTSIDKKLSIYIDSEMSDKEELGAIAREFNRLEMEDSMKEKQKEMEHKKMIEEKERMEKEQDEKLLEEIKKEFDIQDEKEKEEERKELEKELEEKKKEVTEIEKELKTL